MPPTRRTVFFTPTPKAQVLPGCAKGRRVPQRAPARIRQRPRHRGRQRQRDRKQNAMAVAKNSEDACPPAAGPPRRTPRQHPPEARCLAPGRLWAILVCEDALKRSRKQKTHPSPWQSVVTCHGKHTLAPDWTSIPTPTELRPGEGDEAASP